MGMPFHYVMSMKKQLEKFDKQRAEAQKKAEQEARSKSSSRSFSMPSIPKF